jgi:hypothetical protein
MMTPDVPASMRDISAVRNDLARACDRLLKVEEEQRRLNNQLLLLMQGVKERFDVLGVLLTRLESAVAGKDV